ncbi:MAG: two-partner secretion domain-containing protein, partial [Phycisphaerales bacterium]
MVRTSLPGVGSSGTLGGVLSTGRASRRPMGLLRRRLLLGGAALAMCAPAWAGPEGEQVIAGNVNFSRMGPFTQITASNRAIINWSSFNIGRNETVQFIQPSARSRVLNRITGADPTNISGTIIANGIVYIVNPAGVYFREGALVNVGGIYAGAARIADNDFARGTNYFSNVTGQVRNEGVINAQSVAMIGQNVVNTGQINSPGGTVLMAAGDNIYIGERGGTIYAQVTTAADAAPRTGGPGVENSGRINAPAGRVSISTGDMYGIAIRNTGNVRARDVSMTARGGTAEIGGTIDVSAGAGQAAGGRVQITAPTVHVREANINASGPRGGSIEIGGGLQGRGELAHAQTTIVGPGSGLNADATVPGGIGGTVVAFSSGYTGFYGTATARGGQGGKGGIVETSGLAALDVRGAFISAAAPGGASGLWLLDPRDVTIDNGGTFSNPFNPSAGNTVVDVTVLTTTLAGGTNVTITTQDGTGTDAGNITINQPITPNMTAPATLTLRAANDINVGQTINAGGSFGLSLVLSANDQSLGDDGNTGNGAVNITAPIFTRGGSITISNGTNSISAVTATASINAGTGALQIISNGAVNLGAAVTAGSSAITGSSITLGGGAVTTSGGAQTFTGPVVLSANTTLTATSVTFSSTVNGTNAGGESLTIVGGGVFNGDVGSTTALRSLLLTGGATLNLQSVTTSTAGGGSGTQTYGGAVTLNGGNANTVTINAASAVFSGTVNGTGSGQQALAVNGNVTFGANVGSVVGLRELSVTGNTLLNTFVLRTTNAAGGTANQTYGGTITVSTPDDTTANLVTSGGTVTFNGTINGTTLGEQGLAVVGNGVVNAMVGNTVPLSTFGITLISTLNTPSVVTTNAGGGTGEQFFTGNSTIMQDTTLTATGGTVGFGALVDGASVGGQFLKIIGNSSFTDAVGSVVALKELCITGDTLLGGNVTTTNAGGGSGDQIFGGVVLTSIAGTNQVFNATGGTVTFNGALDASGAGLQGITINGNAAFNNTVGAVQPLQQITVSGNTAINTTIVATSAGGGGSGLQNYGGNVTIGGAAGTIAALSGAGTTFSGTVNASGAGTQGLMVTGPATFGGNVGNSGALSSLTLSGATTVTAGTTITTSAAGGGSGNQTYTGALTVGGTAGQTATFASDTGAIAFNSTLNSAGGGARNVQVDTAGTTTFLGTIGGTNALGTFGTGGGGTTQLCGGVINAAGTNFADAVVLTVNTTINDSVGVTFGSTVNSDGTARSLTIIGDVTFMGTVGGVSALTDLTIAGSTSIGANVTTTGDQLYGGDVTLVGAAAVRTLTGVNVIFGGALDAATTGQQGVSVVGDGIFGGDVGGTMALGSLAVSGTAILNGNVTTSNAGGGTGNQTYSSALTLTQDTTFSSTGGTVAFGSTLNGTTAGQESATINGNATFAGAVGGTTALESLSVTGAAGINGGAVTTTGDQTYGTGTTLGASATLTGGTVTFSGTLDGMTAGSQSLTLLADGVFGGNVGSGTSLGSVTVTGTTSIGGDVTTEGDQLYGDAVTLTGPAGVRTLTGNSVTFATTVDAAAAGVQGLSIDGDAFFGDEVGGTMALGSLAVSGTTILNGDVTTTDAGGGTGAQTYTGDVTLTQDTTLTATGGTVSFGGLLDGTTSGTEFLAIVGNAIFSGNVGGATSLQSLNVSGTTALNGIGVTTSGTQVYTGNVTLGGASGAITTLSSSGTTFSGTVNASGAGTQGLMVTGPATFGGNVGNSGALSSL